jgi:hypothetical protein
MMLTAALLDIKFHELQILRKAKFNSVTRIALATVILWGEGVCRSFDFDGH